MPGTVRAGRAVIVAGLLAFTSPGLAAPPTDDAAVRQRVDALLATMTPEEKAGQLVQIFYFDDVPQDRDATLAELRAGRVGSLLFETDPHEINRVQHIAVEETRLKIPVLFAFDVIHGLRTIFPVPIAVAASWDPALAERGQSIAAAEARAVGIHWAFAPMVDIARDPRWGRMVEGAGEDPYLGAAMAAAQVRGFQGRAIGTPDRIIAGPKHFAGYGAALGGRDYDEVDLSDNALWNVYLPPFEAAVKAGAGNIMSAYMGLNGVPAAGNHWLLTDVLRDTWHFKGFVVSDADAVLSLTKHHLTRDRDDAAVRALSAGMDMEMAFSGPAFGTLPDALANGKIDAARLDASVRRILEAKVRMGLFDNPFVDEARAARVLADPSHREAARIAAERSAVLLRNDGGLLPLDPARLKSLAVIGSLADRPRETLGPWTFDYKLDETVSLLAGIRAKLGSAVRVDYAPGYFPQIRKFPSIFENFPNNKLERPADFDDAAEIRKAAALARNSDAVVLVLGEPQLDIGENASRSTLALPQGQQELLDAVVAAGKAVALVLVSGRPLDLRGAMKVPAILEAWYPGTEGGSAVANLLFGATVPGGKLPFSWPRHVGHVPMIYGRLTSQDTLKAGERYWDEESTPLFPFGHGLSYTTFAFENLKLDRASIPVGGTLKVSVDVRNTGTRAADEVAQLYIHQRYGSAARPVRELKGFERVAVAPGETRRVTFTLGPDELRYWSAARKGWVQEASTFDVWVGGDSNAPLTTRFEVK